MKEYFEEQIGERPSQMLSDNYGAEIQKSAGYCVTDFASIVAGRTVLYTIGTRSTFRVSNMSVVEKQIEINSESISFFDPGHRDAARTVITLQHRVEPGTLDVLYFEERDESCLALIFFPHTFPVVGWTPMGDAVPVPPYLPMLSSRFAVGIGDTVAIDAVLDALVTEGTWEQNRLLLKIFGEPARASSGGLGPQQNDEWEPSVYRPSPRRRRNRRNRRHPFDLNTVPPFRLTRIG